MCDCDPLLLLTGILIKRTDEAGTPATNLRVWNMGAFPSNCHPILFIGSDVVDQSSSFERAGLGIFDFLGKQEYFSPLPGLLQGATRAVLLAIALCWETAQGPFVCFVQNKAASDRFSLVGGMSVPKDLGENDIYIFFFLVTS